MKTRYYPLLIFFLFSYVNLTAQISLPGILADHMVLQQNSNVKIWGWGNPGTTLKVCPSWNPGDTVSTLIKSDGSWQVFLKTIAAGGPYELTIMGEHQAPPYAITLKDVMLGEVWLCSGQSNMEWSANNGILAAKEEITGANYPNIRFCRVLRRGAETLQNDTKCDWVQCSPETMAYQSAVAYFFGRALQKDLNVPIGLIVSAWGGTPAEVWTSKETIEKNAIIKKSIPLQGFQWWPTEPARLFNQMIYPLANYRIKGALWYQGESNHERADAYSTLLSGMITDWRTAFGYEFPFNIVQIAPYTYKSKTNGPAKIREAQERVSKQVPQTYLVVVSDLVDNLQDIHPKNKQAVGLRLANLVLAKEYNKPIMGVSSPSLKSATIKGSKIIIDLNDALSGISIKGKQAEGFKISGANGTFVEAKASIKKGKIELSSPLIAHPLYVRYCFEDANPGNVFSKEGLPLAPFRTDKD